MSMNEFQVLNLIFTGGSGILGVGIGIGLFRGVVKQLKKDVEEIKRKQARLRGDSNGGIPVFITRVDCDKVRADCAANSSRQTEIISNELSRHTKAIKTFENFARWSMQNAGLKIEEINQILDMD